jgi:hypothetical protein
LLTQDPEAAAKQTTAAHTTFVSSGVAVNHTQEPDLTKGFLVRDPDGHAIEIAGRWRKPE